MAGLKSWLPILASLTASAWSASMRLPSYPLAVKTPYLSVWMPGHLSHDFPNATPQFWKGIDMTWIVLVRVDGASYCLLGCTGGRPGTIQATQKSLNFTSTHTYVSLDAGSTEFTLDFFSAVDPVDHVRQSLPYSYLTISARNNETTAPEFGVMTAVDTSWLSKRGEPYARSYVANGTKILALNGKQEVNFAEHENMALWGDVVIAIDSPADSDLATSSCQVGSPQSILGSFAETGSLTGAIGTVEYDSIAACSQSVTSTKYDSSVTFAIGIHQDKAVQYFDGFNVTSQAAYFRSKTVNVTDTVQHLFDDYEEALAESRKLDEYVRTIGHSTSANYSDLLEMSVRQSFAGMQVTIPYDSMNTSRPYAFIKEISTNGNMQTLADLIPKSLAIFHVLNPAYTRMFLEPVLRYSLEAWPLNHAVHDIGKHYPNATGERPCIEEFLPLDSTSVLLWMLYLYQDTTGDRELTDTYAPILQKYADYCVRYGLYPVLQRSSVDALGSAPNQTALSVSAAIALNAYGQMTGQSNYTELGIAFAEEILEIGRDHNKTHFKIHYEDDDEYWILMYPLAFDVWLGLDTFPKSVHKSQSEWYSQHQLPYGLQYRNSLRYTLLEWQMWVAASSSNSVRDHVIDAYHLFLVRDTGPETSVPGPSQWVVNRGDDEGRWTRFGRAKSNVGSIWMIAAIQGGFNKSYGWDTISADPDMVSYPLNENSFTIQGSSFTHIDYSVEDVQAGIVDISTTEAIVEYDIPYDVPGGASKPVDSSFLGLSFDTASFPKYMGNRSTPNEDSLNLVHNLVVASDSMLTIRIGSPEADYSIYDPIQRSPLSRINLDGVSTLSIGPAFFDSIRALDRFGRIEWVYQIPFAPMDTTNALLGAQAANDAIPPQRLFAFEIGHKANLYAGVTRPDHYNCGIYAAELFKFKRTLRQNIGRVGRQFQALGLAHGSIDDSWSMEECFTVGIKSQDDLRSVSVHYSQLHSYSDLKSSKFPRHAAIRREHELIVPQANYVNDIFPCHPFIISEASLVSTAADDYDAFAGTSEQPSQLEIGLWNLDFLLYSMSHNISRVLMHQSCNSPSSAWTPAACRHSDTTGDNSTELGGSYYALTFVASFVRDADNFRVALVQENEDTVVYAGYENGKLSKIAIVNYPPRAGTDDVSTFTKKTIDFQVAPEILYLTRKAHISTSDIESGGAAYLTRSWNNLPSMDQVSFEDMSTADYTLENGTLSITTNEPGALLLEVFG